MAEHYMSGGFPVLPWRTASSKNGVTLQEYGTGEALFVLPGMEGSGESCLHLVAPVVQGAASAGHSYRLVLVDYSGEAHKTLDELIQTVHELIHGAVQDEPCVIWGQSFGNLLATGAPRLGGIKVRKFVLVSPFTALPPVKVCLGTLSLRLTPAFLYRATAGPWGRYTFGPVGDQRGHPFFEALRRASPGVVRRRTKWLQSRVFDGYFAETPAPTKVWLGQRDRLVNLPEQRAFFTRLTQARPDYFLAMTEGSGHVVLPSAIARGLQAHLLAWLIGDSQQ